MTELDATIYSVMLGALDWLDAHANVAITLWAVLLILLGINPVRITKENSLGELAAIVARRTLMLFGAAIAFIVVPFAWMLSYRVFEDNRYVVALWEASRESVIGLWPLPVAATLGSILFRLVYARSIRPKLSALGRRLSVRQSRDQLSDVRAEAGVLKTKNFNPVSLYRTGHFLLGLDEKGRPVYEAEERWKTYHQKSIGPTQVGKGVHIGCQLDQAIRKGYTVIMVDPKPDKFAYDIMRESCEAAGRLPPLVLDLNGQGPGRYSPFVAGSLRERRARLLWAFGLNDTGEQADFYKAAERAAIDSVMDEWDGSIAHLRQLLSVRDLYPKTERTRSYLAEWQALVPLNPKAGRGLDLERSILDNRVIYVKASITDPLVIRAATVLVMDLIQTIGRIKTPPAHIYGVLDEVRFMISDVLVKGLATVLDKGCNFTITYQTILDLLALDDRKLNAKAIRQQAEVNTKVTICYQAADSETAEWAASLSGTVRKTVAQRETVVVNRQGGEEWSDERILSKEKEFLITENRMLSLPQRVAACYRPGHLAQLLYTCWVPVKELKGMPPKPAAASDAEAVAESPSLPSVPPETAPTPKAKPKAPKKNNAAQRVLEEERAPTTEELAAALAFINGADTKAQATPKPAEPDNKDAPPAADDSELAEALRDLPKI